MTCPPFHAECAAAVSKFCFLSQLNKYLGVKYKKQANTLLCHLRTIQLFFPNILQGTNPLSPTGLERGHLRAIKKYGAGCTSSEMAKKWKACPDIGMITFPEKQGPEPFIHQTSVCRVALLYPLMSDPTGRYDPGPREPYHLSRSAKHTLERNRSQLST